MTYKGKELSSIIIKDVEIIDYPSFELAFIAEAWSDDLKRYLTKHELEKIDITDVQEYILMNLDLYL